MSAMQFNGKFRPDRHGRYGGHVDVMTSSQADYMMAEVVFCAEWSLNNICMCLFGVGFTLRMRRMDYCCFGG